MSIGNGSLGGLLGEFHCIEHCEYSVVVIWSPISNDELEPEFSMVPDLPVHWAGSVMDEIGCSIAAEHSPAVHTVTRQKQTLRVGDGSVLLELPP